MAYLKSHKIEEVVNIVDKNVYRLNIKSRGQN